MPGTGPGCCIVQILARNPDGLVDVQRYGNAIACYTEGCKVLGREIARVNFCLGVDEDARLASDCPVADVPVTTYQSRRLRVIDTEA